MYIKQLISYSHTLILLSIHHNMKFCLLALFLIQHSLFLIIPNIFLLMLRSFPFILSHYNFMLIFPYLHFFHQCQTLVSLLLLLIHSYVLPNTHGMITRSKVGIFKPKLYIFFLFMALQAYPKSYKEALKIPE